MHKSPFRVHLCAVCVVSGLTDLLPAFCSLATIGLTGTTFLFAAATTFYAQKRLAQVPGLNKKVEVRVASATAAHKIASVLGADKA